jgi:hypothetical protein
MKTIIVLYCSILLHFSHRVNYFFYSLTCNTNVLKDLFQNKTSSTIHKRKEHNPPPRTHMHIKGTYIINISNETEDSNFLVQ